MRYAGLIVAAAFIGVTAAGCLNDGPSQGTAPPTATSTVSSTETAPGPGGSGTLDEPEVPATEMLLSGCIAIQAFRNYPAPIAPGERPDGWEADPPDNIAGVLIFAYRCERVAVAGYERGPFHMLLDWHGNVDAPADCEADANAATHMGILRHVIVDDPEIAAYLQATFLVPALVATFSQQDDDLGAAALRTWSWSINGETPSVLTVTDPRLYSQLATKHYRLFWQVGKGLGALDLQTDGSGFNTELFANGTIQPPLLLASDTGGSFTGNGAWYNAVSARGLFARYADLECKEPIP